MKFGGENMEILKKSKKIKYSALLNEWLIIKQNDIKIQSYQKYENVIIRINESLGDYYINNLVKEDIINFFNSENIKNTSISICKTMLYIINSSMHYAYKKNYCPYLDLKDIKIKNISKNIYIFSKEEQIKIENKIKEQMNIRKLCLILALYTGLRIGEICGLKWEDINLDIKCLMVKRTIERIKCSTKEEKYKTILITSTPKSETSNRIVPIPNFLITYLKKYKTDDNYYILSNSEKLYDPRQYEAFYNRFLKSCNVNYSNFHTLRHTFATRAIESKMDLKTLSEILGHSSVEITLKLYVHPSYELKKKSIENLVTFMTK